MTAAVFLALALLSYLIGAIPFGIIVGKVLRGVDVRDYGSGATGTTNVLRTAGPVAALLVLFGDLGKGMAPVLLAWWLVPQSSWAEALAGIGAIVGHSWPVYAGFRGGKGSATGVGALLIMAPWVGLMALGVFAVVVALTRYVSLGSILGTLAMIVGLVSFVLLGAEPWPYLAFALVGGAILIFRHKDNVLRLMAGTEHRMGERGKRRQVSL